MKLPAILLPVLAMGAAVGWLAPGGEALMSASLSQPAAAPTGAKASPPPSSWLTGQVTLPRAQDGHFYAHASIDGTSVRMLVDTGASVIALTGPDAAAIGLGWSEDDVRPVGRGASGPVLGVPVMLDRVALGDIEGAQIQAIIVPEGLDISLLGQSFLTRAGRIEMQGDTMLLGG
jgi:aspartyl protease family protein